LGGDCCELAGRSGRVTGAEAAIAKRIVNKCNGDINIHHTNVKNSFLGI
jgi:hypothetical protein